MLKSLEISHFILIDHLIFHPFRGFNVITGETGAGKSILLQALSLLMGNRADTSVIANNKKKCIIEGIFTEVDEEILHIFQENDIDVIDNDCIIRREIISNGRSRAFINDTPISLALLKQISEKLIDIHSQHKNLLIGDRHFRIDLLDLYAGQTKDVKAYTNLYQEYINISKTLKLAKERLQDEKREQDYIQFCYDQIASANLSEDEDQTLEKKQAWLAQSAERKILCVELSSQILGNDSIDGLIFHLKEIEKRVEQSKEIIDIDSTFISRIREARIDLEDIGTTIQQKGEDTEMDEDELSAIESRLNLINELTYKYKVHSSNDLLRMKDEFFNRLIKMSNSEDEIDTLATKREKIREQLFALAHQLSTKREEAASEIKNSMLKLLPNLEMPYARFDIQFNQLDKPNNLGQDEVLFLFSANKQGELAPIQEIASGGEVSRLMLCLKSLIAGKRTLPTIIFDEIDTGVSGKVADKMARLMQELGNGTMQIITITHLPQIAAAGKHHFFIYKEHLPEMTVSRIVELTDDKRIEEVAKMQSGEELSKISFKAATELIESYKKNII